MKRAASTSPRPAARQPDPRADGALVTKALLRAVGRLDLANKELAPILGLSEASVSRLARGRLQLLPAQKAYEIALLFVRLYRSLDSIAGGDADVAKAWLRAENSALGAVPLARIRSITGLMDAIAYLDARRAPV